MKSSMPYINEKDRVQIDSLLDQLTTAIRLPNNTFSPGMLEYAIFKLCHQITIDSRCFTNMNAIVGVLETTKAEFLARIMTPYEQLKLIDNWTNAKI